MTPGAIGYWFQGDCAVLVLERSDSMARLLWVGRDGRFAHSAVVERRFWESIFGSSVDD